LAVGGRRGTCKPIFKHVSFFGPIGSMVTIGVGERSKNWMYASTLWGKGSALCPTALHFDPEPMQGSPAGTTAATVAGRPIKTGRRSSTTKAMPDQYAMNCAALQAQCRGHQRRSTAGRPFSRHGPADAFALRRVLVGAGRTFPDEVLSIHEGAPGLARTSSRPRPPRAHATSGKG